MVRHSEYVYVDGIITNANGKPLHGRKATDKDEKANKKLKQGAKQYCKDFIEALIAGNVPKPSGGDCWYCYMREKKTGRPLGDVSGASHIPDHIAEKYYVPSFLYNALTILPSSAYEHGIIGNIWAGNPVSAHDKEYLRDWTVKRFYRYVVSQLGLAR